MMMSWWASCFPFLMLRSSNEKVILAIVVSGLELADNVAMSKICAPSLSFDIIRSGHDVPSYV